MMDKKKLTTLTYVGLAIILLDVLLSFYWFRTYASEKVFHNSPGTFAFLFAIGCMVSAFMFGFGLTKGGKKSTLATLFIVSSVTVAAGLGISLLLASISEF
jgi:hypothetical protein